MRFLGRSFIVFLLWCMSGTAIAGGLGDATVLPSSTAIELPLEVGVGIEISQVTSVDQKAENFSVVATLRMHWTDPLLAFDPQEYGQDHKIFRPDDFIDLAQSIPTLVPAFEVQNQQQNRWIQDSIVIILPDGKVEYFEKSSATLQAPHFNFVRFPFDTQKFFFDIVSVYPIDIVTYLPLNDLSGLGPSLGEEEWILENDRIQVSTDLGLTGLESQQASLAFEGKRHIQYYALRIFIPLLVLVSVSWATFFLDEYRRRIDLAAGNLLVFVAFNFAVSESLPKLGYVTFLDFIFQCMFVLTGAVILANVALRRLKLAGREDLAHKIDIYAVKWILPLAYAAVVSYAVVEFLV